MSWSWDWLLYYGNMFLDLVLGCKIYIQERLYPLIFGDINDNAFVIVKLYKDKDSIPTIIRVDRNDLEWEYFEGIYDNNLTFESWIEIEYYMMGNKYRVVYHYADVIQFPVYSEKEIREFMSSSRSIMPIIYATKGDVEITKEFSEYLGPKMNLYKDKGLDIYVNNVLPEIKGDIEITTDSFETLLYEDNKIINL